MQDFTMDYDLPSGDSDILLPFGMQMCSRIQLVEGTMTNYFNLSSHISQGPDERQIESVAKSVLAGYMPPIDFPYAAIVTFLGIPITLLNPWYCTFQKLISSIHTCHVYNS